MMQHIEKKYLLSFLFFTFGLILLIVGILQWWLNQPEKISVRLKPMAALMTPWSNPQVPSDGGLPSISQLNSIFAQDHTWTATLAAERTQTVFVTGDVLTARTVNAKVLENQDFRWPFLNTVDTLRQAELLLINLETPLVRDCPIKNDGMIFCGDPRHSEGLRFAGVDIANLGNNHGGNYGVDGVNQTVQILEQVGIPVSGVKGPVYKTVDGVKFAFLGYNEVDQQPGVTRSELPLIEQELALARSQAEVVIVQFHWGNEYTYKPSSHQKELARFAIDHGADLVVGNHPHWFQPIEFYQGKLIAYSHGNFIFDQMWSRETREGIVGKYTFYDRKLVDVEFLPVFIEEFGQPRWATGQQGQNILDKLAAESYTLAGETAR